MFKQAESAPFDAQKAAIRCKEKSRRSKCCHPEEMPVIPEQAMEYLSRTWSPSSSDLFKYSPPAYVYVHGPQLQFLFSFHQQIVDICSQVTPFFFTIHIHAK